MKIDIIPAILPRDFAEVEDHIALIVDQIKTVQIDICDGRFTPEATWPYRKHDDNFDLILKEEQGLPGWEKLDFEIDLMVDEPTEMIDDWVTAGAKRIIIHIEAKGDVMKTVEMLQGRVEIGLALNIGTPLAQLEPFKGKIQSVQFMGIDHVGFQGQEFDEKVIDVIKKFREANQDLPISVDGGVSLDNARSLIDAGATRLVVGSAIFGADNYLDALKRFKDLAR